MTTISDLEGATALHYAACGGHNRIFTYLANTNPDALLIEDIKKRTALHEAAAFGLDMMVFEVREVGGWDIGYESMSSGERMVYGTGKRT
jgi:hypothetical protein